MTITDTPLHVTGMERLLEFSADFIGREALQRAAEEGVVRKLVGVTIGEAPLRRWREDSWPVERDGLEVGRLTSASHSFWVGENIGHVRVPIELAEPGTELILRSPDGPVPAVTAARPFVDRARTSRGPRRECRGEPGSGRWKHG